MSEATACEHMNFIADVEVNRITSGEGGPVTSFSCDVRVKCAECGQPFRFIYPDVGLLPDRPTVSADGRELRTYCEPSDGSLVGSARPPGFRVQASREPPHESQN